MAFTATELAERTLHRRAVEAVIWGMPAVNAELMFQAMRDAKADFNQVVYWSQPVSWKNQTLTPNPDPIYLMPFFNTKDAGPIVLDIPPTDGENSITGSIDEGWQTAIEDVGPAGIDKGKGGKYLILPPGYLGQTPEGYIALQSRTFAGFALLRSNFKSADDANIAKAVAYGKRVRFYPLAEVENPHETKFVDALDVVFDSTIPYNLRFFQVLDQFLQREPWQTRDKIMIYQLKTVGIEKSKPFSLDTNRQKILNDAVREARAWLDGQYERIFSPPFNEDSHWALPASQEVPEAMQTQFAKPDAYPVDGRGTSYSMAFFSAKHLGAGQYYLMTIVDEEGQPLYGGSTYCLRVPPNPPVTLYWSATVYDRATHGLIRNLSWSSRSSNTPAIQKNADGSVDIYFGTKAPEGKESNWIPTSAAGKFEVLFRFYGPEKALFKKSWKLPDIEQTATAQAGKAARQAAT